MNELFITPIQPWSFGGELQPAAQTLEEIGSSVFQDFFQEAIDNVRTTDQNLAEQEYLLATGQTENPHAVMVAASEAQLSVDMLVSLRNKALSVYNELMRISL